MAKYGALKSSQKSVDYIQIDGRSNSPRTGALMHASSTHPFSSTGIQKFDSLGKKNEFFSPFLRTQWLIFNVL